MAYLAKFSDAPLPLGLAIMDRCGPKARSEDAPEASALPPPCDRLTHLSDHTIREPLAQLRPQDGSSLDAEPSSQASHCRNSGDASDAAHDRRGSRGDHSFEPSHLARHRDTSDASFNPAHKDRLHRASTSTLPCVTTTAGPQIFVPAKPPPQEEEEEL